MNKDFEKLTHNIIRKHFAKMLKYFVENKRISDQFFVDCNREILGLLPSFPKPPKYELLNNEGGLYVKKNKKFSSPCFVVAGGSSIENLDFSILENQTTIVSNKTIFDVPNADYFITTDYTFLTHLKKEKRYDEWKKINCMKFFVVNCISDVIQIKDGEITDVRYGLKYELQDFNEIVICKSAKSVGYNFENFNSGYNSGFSSFQLAILLGYNPIYLLGMDMISSGEKTHHHGGYGRSIKKMNENLSNYEGHFKNVLQTLKIERPDLKVISCSPISLLNEVIEYKPIEEIL